MINTDRIVPVTATDLVSLYSVILAQDSNNSGMVKATATNPGVFAITSGSIVLANEPVKALDLASAITAIKVYFVPAFDFKGFTQAGTPVTIADGSAEVEPDGRTLYSATLATGEVTFAKIGF